MRQIITHFTDDDLYKFTMCCAVIDNYPRAQVRYIFKDRGDTVYPQGFERELRWQIDSLASLRITDEEIGFMKRACPYIPYWFYNYLKGFRYEPELVKISVNEEGRLRLGFEGSWASTILLEVKTLAIISELYYEMTGAAASFDFGKFADKTIEKGVKLIEAGCVFSDFGTRRRASFRAQDCAIGALGKAGGECAGPGAFMGTSNVYLAMKYDLVPIGTMAHELICAI
ncbi:MAG: nicotinate phosphoribosyltransferase, partial [Desulfovibrio sp.]|nr:nicotinate phosphoribosyltransferase [Desulfovibrio sp.]